VLTVNFKLPALKFPPPEKDKKDVPLFENMVYKSFNISIATSALMLHMGSTPGQSWQVRGFVMSIHPCETTQDRAGRKREQFISTSVIIFRRLTD